MTSATVSIQYRTPLKGAIYLTLLAIKTAIIEAANDVQAPRRQRLALKQNHDACTCGPFNFRQQQKQLRASRLQERAGDRASGRVVCDDRAVRGGNVGKPTKVWGPCIYLFIFVCIQLRPLAATLYSVRLTPPRYLPY